MKIITVLKTGGIYKPEHVATLYEQCKIHAPGVEFVCISNDNTVPGYIEMKHDWPSWWCKMELYRIPGPCFYMDLDTIVIRDITHILQQVEKHEFISLRDFYPGMNRTVASGILAWRGDVSYLYNKFLENPEQHIKENSTNRWWGDQGFLERNVSSPSFWQDLVPNSIVSWKVHCKGGRAPQTAKIVAFHGKPKPWEVQVKL